MRLKLTDKKLAAFKSARLGTRRDYLDALMPGLLVRVTDKGSKTFMLRARYPGSPNSSRRALGKVGALSVTTARDKARKWHELLDQGTDPAWQAEQDRLALLRSQDNAFLSVAEAYFAHIKSEGFKKAKVHEREIRKEIVVLGGAADPRHHAA
jgi:hypothetical protein